MNLDELRTVQNKERQKDSLQHLRESFYEDVADYIEELERERDRLASEAENPFSEPEVRQLSDEIDTAREVAEAIYERRLGKLVKRASLAAADMPADAEGLTAEERELFDDVVDRIEDNKSRVLDVVEGGDGDSDGDSGGETRIDEEAAETATGAADVMGSDAPGDPVEGTPGSGTGSDEPQSPNRDATSDADTVTADADGSRQRDHVAFDDDPDEPDDREVAPSAGMDRGAENGGNGESGSPTDGLDDRTTVRITDDVGEIFGVDDRDYELSADDVVTLPAANAEPLLERDAAERLD